MKKRWSVCLVLFVLLSSACAVPSGQAEGPGTAEETFPVVREAQRDADSQVEEKTETSGLYEPADGQWEAYAACYDDFLRSEKEKFPEAELPSICLLQMIDLDQNGVPELVLYSGAATAVMDFAIFTIEDGRVKSLMQTLPSRWTDEAGGNQEEIPTTKTTIPNHAQMILFDSAYMFMDERILPFSWDHGAFSVRRDAQTDESFWMLACFNNQGTEMDGVRCNCGGEYWKFTWKDETICPERLQSFGLDWDDTQPYEGMSQMGPREEPQKVSAPMSQAPVVRGEMSKDITNAFLQLRDETYPPIDDAPEASEVFSVDGNTADERSRQVETFFARFAGAVEPG